MFKSLILAGAAILALSGQVEAFGWHSIPKPVPLFQKAPAHDPSDRPAPALRSPAPQAHCVPCLFRPRLGNH
jgi:hypothetical protein